jgi:hypothetical protein
MRSLSLFVVVVLVGACGPSGALPGATHESGQSKLIEQTFAGKHTCNPEDHERPFVVEWDATDTSSFQARAANDVIVVKYDGCRLIVLDSCNDDAVRGSFGSYKPIEWTSGAIEKVDIANEIDLHAKLPLGEALLGGRVRAGEKFHMEYFVSGTRSATRPALYRADISKVPGCAGATHFVYGFNLGAYALATQTSSNAGVEGTALGASAGASRASASQVEKKAGDVAACRGESAREIDGCKVPIRLTLRAITDGENPDQKAARAEETPTAANLAGKLEARTATERKAAEHLNAAFAKLGAEDGRGCLADLDQHDQLDPRPEGLSTSPKGFGSIRAKCIMLTGQCAAGRALERKVVEAQPNAPKPERIDDAVDLQAGQYCRGAGLTERDRLLVALHTLTSHDKKRSSSDCNRAYEEVKALIGRVQKRDDHDPIRYADSRLENDSVRCFAEAGDCPAAWRATKETQVLYAKRTNVDMSYARTRQHMITTTKALCEDKDQGPLSDEETLARWLAELEDTERASQAICSARLDRGLAALKKLGAAGKKPDASSLATTAARCFAKVDACDDAWRRFVETRGALGEVVSPDRSTIGSFESAAPACQAKAPPAALTPQGKVAWATVQLGETRDAAVCQAALTLLERNAPPEPPKQPAREWNAWRSAHRSFPSAAATCLSRAGDCKAAWAAYQRAAPRFDPTEKSTEYRKEFERVAHKCK